MSYVIKKPLITEKNSLMAEKGIYVFEVSLKASKTTIREHIERYFEVKTMSVKTSIGRKRGRRLRGGRGQHGAGRYWKKAFVRLRPGEQITAFEGG